MIYYIYVVNDDMEMLGIVTIKDLIMAEPKEISNYITNLTTDSNSYMTGQTLTVAGGE